MKSLMPNRFRWMLVSAGWGLFLGAVGIVGNYYFGHSAISGFWLVLLLFAVILTLVPIMEFVPDGIVSRIAFGISATLLFLPLAGTAIMLSNARVEKLLAGDTVTVAGKSSSVRSRVDGTVANG